MIRDEAIFLWYPVAAKVFKDYPISHCEVALELLLKCKEYSVYASRSYEDDVPMLDELKQKLVLLNSPHWHTILAANGITKQDLQRIAEESVKEYNKLLTKVNL